MVNRVKRKQVAPLFPSSHAPISTSNSSRTAHLAYASWLEDGRRLRALHRANTTESCASPASPASPASAPAIRISQQNIYLVGATAPTTLPLLAPASVSLPLGAEGAALATPATLATDENQWADDFSHLPTSLDDVDKLTEAQRRLVFLRYLVRQRIYNEGFSAQQTPDQYRPHERQSGDSSAYNSHDDHDDHDDRDIHDAPRDPRPQSDWN